MPPDPVGELLRRTPRFRGKGRLQQWWLGRRSPGDVRTRILPGGTSIACDVSVPYEAEIWLGLEERNELRVLQMLLQPGHTFVDCGANIGLWTLVASRKVEPGGLVVAFEPQPTTYGRLLANVRANGCENARCVQAALGDRSGSAYVRLDGQHNCATMLSEPTGSSAAVPVTRLDSELEGLKVDGCKIDVEGSELEVVEGARGLLERERPWLCVEFNTLLAGTTTLEEWPVHRILCEAGYRAVPVSSAMIGNVHETIPSGWRARGYVNLFYFPS